MLLFAFYALCHFGSLDYYHQIFYCCYVPDANSRRRCTSRRSNCRKEVFIPDVSFHSLSLIVNIWKMEIRLSFIIKLHLSVFSFNPPFVLFIFFFWLSVILYSAAALWEHLLRKIKRFLLFTHIPSPNQHYFSTSPVYTCTVLLFVLCFLCLHICCCHHQHSEDDHISMETHFPPSSPLIKLLPPPPVNMNVTCILCFYTIEIQHISPLYT